MSEKINKDIIAIEISEKYGLSKAESRRIVDYVFDRITEVVVNKGEASIYGFGKFETRERNARKGFNPSTQEKIKIKSTTVPIFKPSKPLRDSVDKGEL